jgi:hypothetical protein
MTFINKNPISLIEWLFILASVNSITVSLLMSLLLNCKKLNCWLSAIIILNIQTFLIINSFKWNIYKRKENIDSYYIISYIITLVFSILMAGLYTYKIIFDIYIVIYILSITQVSILFDVITYHFVNNMRNIKND